jgi:hypothetical protein
MVAALFPNPAIDPWRMTIRALHRAIRKGRDVIILTNPVASLAASGAGSRRERPMGDLGPESLSWLRAAGGVS